MAYCKYCGTNNGEEAKYCTNCGSPLSVQPRREENPQPEQEYVQSQGHWVLDTFLAAIPLVGLILLIVWSVTDQPDLSKQRWARASLIWAIIGIVATMVIGVLFGALIAGLGTAYL